MKGMIFMTVTKKELFDVICTELAMSVPEKAPYFLAMRNEYRSGFYNNRQTYMNMFDVVKRFGDRLSLETLTLFHDVVDRQKRGDSINT